MSDFDAAKKRLEEGHPVGRHASCGILGHYYDPCDIRLLLDKVRELGEEIERLTKHRGLLPNVGAGQSRTLEEITYDAWVAVHTPGNLSREVIFAALREAADAARREERKALRRDYREWASGFLSGPSQVATEAWLDARSRAEEPK